MSLSAEAQPSPQPSLTETFNLFAQEAVQDFPNLTGRLAIMDAATRYYYGVIDLAKTGFDTELSLRERLGQICPSAKVGKSPFAQYDSQHKLFTIAFTHDNDPFLSQPEQDTMFTLDHELGHHVVQDAHDGDTVPEKNFGECAADVFASLKHVQRFGGGTGFIDRLMWRRAIDFSLSTDATHFTTFALEALKPLLDNIDIDHLTPKQMVGLSWRIAAKFSLSQPLIDNMSMAFKEVRAKCKEGTLAEGLTVLADLICGDVGYNTFKIGLTALKPYLETGITFHGKAIDLTSDYWNRVRKTLAEKEFRLAADDMLFGMPVVQPALPAANQNVPALAIHLVPKLGPPQIS